MERKRELILANLAGLGVVLVALLAGWRDAALFGLAVLAILDLLVIVRGRLARLERDADE